MLGARTGPDGNITCPAFSICGDKMNDEHAGPYLPISSLVHGQMYRGISRNSGYAMWCAFPAGTHKSGCFLYKNFEFGYWYLSFVFHPDEDNRYSTFAAFEPVCVEQVPEDRRVSAEELHNFLSLSSDS
jgi:hypothetical protein